MVSAAGEEISECHFTYQVRSFSAPSGAYLLQCGGVEIKLGESRRRFEEKVAKDVITPLKAFMEVDIKSILVSLLHMAEGTWSLHISHSCREKGKFLV